MSAVYHDEPLVAESFRTGGGLPWGKDTLTLNLNVMALVLGASRGPPGPVQAGKAASRGLDLDPVSEAAHWFGSLFHFRNDFVG